MSLPQKRKVYGEALIIGQSNHSSKWHELDKVNSVLNYIKFIGGTVLGRLKKKLEGNDIGKR